MGMLAALPFLGVRAAYSFLSSFSPINLPGTAQAGETNSFSRFSILTGEWQIYLAMGVIMEMIVVATYCLVGTMLPLGFEDDDSHSVNVNMKPYNNNNGMEANGYNNGYNNAYNYQR